jgi:hypothetical protein
MPDTLTAPVESVIAVCAYCHGPVTRKPKGPKDRGRVRFCRDLCRTRWHYARALWVREELDRWVNRAAEDLKQIRSLIRELQPRKGQGGSGTSGPAR